MGAYKIFKSLEYNLFKKDLFVLFYMWVFCSDVFLFTPFAYSVFRSQKNLLEWNYRGLRAVDWVLKPNPDPLQEQQVFLTRDPPLQHLGFLLNSPGQVVL